MVAEFSKYYYSTVLIVIDYLLELRSPSPPRPIKKNVLNCIIITSLLLAFPVLLNDDIFPIVVLLNDQIFMFK